MVKILITMIAAVVISLPSAAQQERKFIRGGNDLFNKQDFEKAEVEYRKALDTEVKSYEGAFNLGTAASRIALGPVEKELSADSGGASSITYRGNPSLGSVVHSSASSVRQAH